MKIMNDMIFNSYLVGEEREEAIEEARLELIFAKVDMMFEMVEMRLQQNLREAELKVFSEGGTYGDFQYLVEEAENEASEKKQGIIATLWNAIKSVLKKIGERLAAINVAPGDENTEVDVDENDVKASNSILKAVDEELPKAEDAVKRHDFTGALDIVKKIVITGAVVAAGAAVVTKKYTKGNLMKIKQTLIHAKEKIEAFFGRIFGNNDSGGDESVLHKVGSTIKSNILDPVTKLIGKLEDYIKSGVTKAQNAIAGEWKEVAPNTENAISCVEQSKENLEKNEMRVEDLKKKGCTNATPGKWYIKETEKNGNKRQYEKCNENDPGALKVVADNETIGENEKKIHAKDVKGVADVNGFVRKKEDGNTNTENKATYVKCRKNTKNALQVVADDKDPFDPNTMVKVSDVGGVASVGNYVKKNDSGNNSGNNQPNNTPKYVKCNSGDQGALQVVEDNKDPFDASKMIKVSDVGGVASVNEFVKEDNTNADNNQNNSSPSGYEYSDVNELTKGIKGKKLTAALIKISDNNFAGGIHIKDDNDADANKKGNMSLSKAKKWAYPKDLAVNDAVIKVALKYDRNAKVYKLNNDPNTATKAVPVPDGTPLSLKVVDSDTPAAGEVSRNKYKIAGDVNSVILESEDNIEDFDFNPFMESTNEAYDNEIKEIAAMLACL